MAELLAKRAALELGMEPVDVRSAGTHAGKGSPASDGARRAAARHGEELDGHRSTHLSPDLVEWADWIFAMGPGHLHQVFFLGGGDKAVLLGEFALGEGTREDQGGGMEMAVPDPFGGGDEEYEETYLTLEKYVNLAMKRLAEGMGG